MEVDLSKAKTGKTSTGVEVTFTGTRVADASEVASEPTAGMVPLVIQFEYRNQGAQAVKLQPVPLTVYYGPDKYEAKQPTLYQGGMTRTELPKQIAPGSTVPVADTFLVPAEAILSVEVDPGGSSTPGALPVIFAGVPVK
ncbi:hypothetical protein ABC337_05105 [Arthrobacter sp. 1P04PC]|uniref:hypothetical protein n=1 Tax=Arthrobacter sp. 1P04PC TaxID=3132262 RepID=UPI0039A1AB33